eukprot:scaffold7838_cov81-Skeletonema_dohrnii-CCMP3373.AAC.5
MTKQFRMFLLLLKLKLNMGKVIITAEMIDIYVLFQTHIENTPTRRYQSMKQPYEEEARKRVFKTFLLL